MTGVVRTAVSETEAMIQLAERPAEVVLADTAVTRPDSVGFTRRVLARAPQAQLVLFGAEDPRVAAAAVAAGARGVIRGVEHDLVSVVAKALLLLLLPVRPQGMPINSANVQPATVGCAGRNNNSATARGLHRDGLAMAGSPAMLPNSPMVPAQRGDGPGMAAGGFSYGGDDLRLVWRLIAESSLGSAQELIHQVDPVRAARLAAQVAAVTNSSSADPEDLHFLLLAYVRACYDHDGDVPDRLPQLTRLAALLVDAHRPELAQQLWRLVAAAGDHRAFVYLGRLLEDTGRVPEAVEQYWQAGSDPTAREALMRLTTSGHGDRLEAVTEQRSDGSSMSTGRRLTVTERELQVLRGMADGKSNAEIGRELFVSEDSVKTHARRLFRKLGARDRAHAVAAGFRAGLVT
jgi:DNA-binding NarL/FixJ family response regulator